MILTIKELRLYIRPIIATAVHMDDDPNAKIDVTTNAILEIIKQDREAIHAENAKNRKS